MSKSKDNIYVEISEAFTADRALRKFKRMCDNYGIIKEYRKREYYAKPSVRLKEKQEAAEKRRKKAISKNVRYSKKL